jgi:hypothetical protein
VANYPYISGQAPLVAAVGQLRKGFPSKVDAGYLQRFNIAPGNESYVIAILRFLGLIDEAGNRVESKTDYFFANDDSFQSGLESTMRTAYSQLFDEMGDGALEARRPDLIHWFRASDKTSEVVGQRQATTFQVLAALAGHGDAPATRGNGAKRTAAAPSAPEKKNATKTVPVKKGASAANEGGVFTARDDSGAGKGGEVRNTQGVGLTVRIEVNLPPGGDADTYDAIFASIKKHLMS